MNTQSNLFLVLSRVGVPGSSIEVEPGSRPKLEGGEWQLGIRVDMDNVAAVWKVSEGNYALSEAEHYAKGGSPIFLQKFSVRGMHTEALENGVRLLVLTKDNELHHHHVVVVVQGGRTFIVSVLKGAAPLRRSNGFLSCNHSQIFPQMLRNLDHCPETSNVPNGTRFESKPPAKLNGNEARVKWFHIGRQAGVVRLANGKDAKIHWTVAPADANGYRTLYPGQIVIAAEVMPNRDRRSDVPFEVTSLRLPGEAVPFEAPPVFTVAQLLGEARAAALV